MILQEENISGQISLKEVSVWIALYFTCFSVEIVLPFFRSEHKSPVHNSPLKKLAFRKEYVQDTVMLFLR